MAVVVDAAMTQRLRSHPRRRPAMTPPANPADYSVGIEMSVQESLDGAVLPVLSALVPLWHTPVLGTYYAGHRPSTTPVNLKKEDVNQLDEGRLASYGAVSSMRMALLLIRHTDDAVLTVMNTVLSGALWDQDDPDDHWYRDHFSRVAASGEGPDSFICHVPMLPSIVRGTRDRDAASYTHDGYGYTAAFRLNISVCETAVSTRSAKGTGHELSCGCSCTVDDVLANIRLDDEETLLLCEDCGEIVRARVHAVHVDLDTVFQPDNPCECECAELPQELDCTHIESVSELLSALSAPVAAVRWAAPAK